MGLAAGVGGNLLSVGHWALYAGAGLAAGSGFWMISRAAKHLWQYGSRLGATILGAFSGVGAMAVMWSLGQALLSLGLIGPGTVLSSLGLVGGIGATWLASVVLTVPGRQAGVLHHALDSVCTQNGLARLGIVPRSLRAMLRQSVPTYDQAPSLGSNVMRISALGALSNSNLMLAYLPSLGRYFSSRLSWRMMTPVVAVLVVALRGRPCDGGMYFHGPWRTARPLRLAARSGTRCFLDTA